jgi:hypothetical protein
MSERDKPFTVNDRRHFTPEGHARAESPEVGAAQPVAEPGPRLSTSAGSSAPAGPVEFAQFLLSLGAQAGLLLSPEQEASGGDALEAAKQIISVLEMLEDKTEGRRTHEESEILENLLFQLRLAYVERAKRP